jgi:hypothetical protein
MPDTHESTSESTSYESSLNDPAVEELMIAAGLVPSRGRREKVVKYEVLRGLEDADLEGLSSHQLPVPQGGEVISKLRETHHAIARMLAAGAKDFQICAEIGYSATRISTLKTSPMFMELVEFYRNKATQAFMTGQEKLAMIGITAINEVAERLEENPEKFNNRELLELIEMAGDRTFAPSKSQKGNPSGVSIPAININFVSTSPEGAAQGGVIDVEATSV